MRFGSVCSGIEAASVAWNPLGWHAAWFAEIEPFPCAVLAHHYPDVPNYGDMTTLPDRILSGEIEAPDMLCGGTPCQAFSVAGQRRSLDDARGNLSLTFCEIADAIDTARLDRGLPASIVFWENVPGVLNTKDNAFGCFLAELVGADVPLSSGANGKWPSAGYVAGPKRKAAWRVLDAQHFGVPQRRRRVFVIASVRDDFDPSEILFERPSMQRDFESSGEARQGASAESENGIGSASERANPNGRIVGTLTALDFVKEANNNQVVDSGQLIVEKCYTQTSFANYNEGVGTIRASGGDLGGGSENLLVKVEAMKVYDAPHNFARVEEHDICPTLIARAGTGGGNVPLVLFNHHKQDGRLTDSGGVVQTIMACTGKDSPTLVLAVYENQRSEVRLSDKSNAITRPGGKPGQGNPVVLQEVYPINMANALRKSADGAGGIGVGAEGEPMFTLTTSSEKRAVAVISNEPPKPIPINTQAIAPRSGDVTDRVGLGVGNEGDPANTLGANHCHGVFDMQARVRKLTPRECERLQGFPDDYTRIPWRGKSAEDCPDSPRYKAIGNSWAVPCVRWIGERIKKELEK